MGIGLLSDIANRIRRPLWVRRLEKSLDRDDSKLVRLGTERCGWTVPASAVKSGGTAVCVGAGEDISFDVALNKKGFNVITLDPTPRAKEHVTRVLEAAEGGPPVGINNSPNDLYDLKGFDKSRFKFIDIGLWDENTTKRFFAPKDKHHVSHSIVNLQKTNEWFEAKCETLKTLCSEIGIRHIDVLKMDVEGSEYVVLRNIIESGMLPGVLCFEFDEIRSPIDANLMERIYSTIDLLTKAGYKFRHLETANALFVQDK